MNNLFEIIKEKKLVLKIVLLLLVTIIPWSLNNSSNEITPMQVTDDLSFYEINTCEFSLAEILIKNPNISYQKHYKLRPNNYSSVRCFGKITGIDRIGNTFYLSVGTNSLVGLILKFIPLVLIISLIKKHKPIYKFLGREYINTLFISTSFLTYGVYAEKRFYSKNLYFLNLEEAKSYFVIFLFLFFGVFCCLELINKRYNYLINFFPFLFVFIGVLGGFNLHIYTFFLVILGIISLVNNERNKFIYFYALIIGPLFWILNSQKYDYYLDLDKIVGFSSSQLNLHSAIYWSMLFFLLLNGLYIFVKRNIKNLDYKLIKNNLMISSSLVVIFGLLGASATLINYLNFFYFGQNKVGMPTLDVADGNAWRGFFPSAETIGEFYGLTILFFFIYSLEAKTKINKIELFIIAFPLFGLVKSNNISAVIGSLLIFAIYYLSKKKIEKSKIITYSLLLVTSVFIFLFINDFFYSLSFTNYKIVDEALFYSNEYQLSTSLDYIQNSSSILTTLAVSLLSTISFYINRSILWGIFFTRYNPTSLEFFLGTGPLNLSKHYSEIQVNNYDRTSAQNYIKNVDAFLLPHSSFLDILLYFGLLGILFGIFFTLKLISKRNRIDSLIFYPMVYLLINFIKDDSILYLPSLITIMIFGLISTIQSNTNKD
tara:strand:+ start:579 stop:2546 length:1968 start_codon:yes stop_codon:yes gene_type:complete